MDKRMAPLDLIQSFHLLLQLAAVLVELDKTQVLQMVVTADQAVEQRLETRQRQPLVARHPLDKEIMVEFLIAQTRRLVQQAEAADQERLEHLV